MIPPLEEEIEVFTFMLRLDFGDKQVPTKMAALSIAVNKNS